MADTVPQLVIVQRMMSDLGPLEFHDKLKEAHLRLHSYFLFILNSLVWKSLPKCAICSLSQADGYNSRLWLAARVRQMGGLILF